MSKMVNIIITIMIIMLIIIKILLINQEIKPETAFNRGAFQRDLIKQVKKTQAEITKNIDIFLSKHHHYKYHY